MYVTIRNLTQLDIKDINPFFLEKQVNCAERLSRGSLCSLPRRIWGSSLCGPAKVKPLTSTGSQGKCYLAWQSKMSSDTTHQEDHTHFSEELSQKKKKERAEKVLR